MTNEKLEQCLAQALEKTAPHDVDGVLSRCEKRKGTEIPMKTKPHSLKKWMAMAACLALLLLCGGGLFLRQANAVASTSTPASNCGSTKMKRFWPACL